MTCPFITLLTKFLLLRTRGMGECLSRPFTFGVDSRTLPAFVSEPCEPGIVISPCLTRDSEKLS